MDSSGVQWIEPPERLAEGIEEYGEKAIAAIYAVADYFARFSENEMRRNAPWTDRTGNARSGLFSETEKNAAQAVVEIFLSHGHSIDYGVYLELANGGKYAIVLPTLEKHIKTLEKMLQGIFRE